MTYAYRAKKAEAKQHMLAGGKILVSEYGHEVSRPVTPLTTTHQGGLAEWNALEATVRECRNRYPNQRYYIVKE